jgi:hypothetical protein
MKGVVVIRAARTAAKNGFIENSPLEAGNYKPAEAKMPPPVCIEYERKQKSQNRV